MEDIMGQTFNIMSYDDEKKLFDEHQQLYLDLSNSYFDRKSILFFNPEIIIEPYKGHGSYFETIINLKKSQIDKEIKNNILYLPGIKISNNKIYTEKELGKTISEDILSEQIYTTYYYNGHPKWPIFKHFNLYLEHQEEIEPKSSHSNIPKELIDCIKKIEQLEVEITKQKNNILNSTYVKTKLNSNLKNIDNYISLVKLVKNNGVEQFIEND
jgi:hypothetical protein